VMRLLITATHGRHSRLSIADGYLGERERGHRARLVLGAELTP